MWLQQPRRGFESNDMDSTISPWIQPYQHGFDHIETVSTISTRIQRYEEEGGGS